MKLYELLQLGDSAPHWLEEEWNRMQEKCYENYLLCCFAMSKSFQKLYESTAFHDMILEEVRSAFDAKTGWSVTIRLRNPYSAYVEEWDLCFSDVRRFTAENLEESRIPKLPEEYLNGEFYVSPKDPRRVVHEFFTSQGTFFALDFSKVSCKKVRGS